MGTPGGPDSVVGSGDNENTPVVFALAGVGATGAGTAAGAGAAGLNGASGASQGYCDPESGQWVEGSPPLPLPSLPSLEQLAATNPVIGNIYRVYAAAAQAMASAALSENSNEAALPESQVENPSKQKSPIWNDLENSGGGRKSSGSGSRRCYYEWDHTHDDIEVYDRNGRHLGSMNPTTGELYKPPVPGKRIKL